MKKTVFSIVCAGIVMTGCTSAPKGEALLSLSQGTSMSMVHEKLGKPDHVSLENGLTSWHYTISTGWLDYHYKIVDFKKGVLVALRDDRSRAQREHELDKIRTQSQYDIEKAKAGATRIELNTIQEVDTSVSIY